MFEILLYVLGAILIVVGGFVILRPANFTKKDKKELPEAVMKTKRLGLISVTMGIMAVAAGVVFSFIL